MAGARRGLEVRAAGSARLDLQFVAPTNVP